MAQAVLLNTKMHDLAQIARVNIAPSIALAHRRVRHIVGKCTILMRLNLHQSIETDGDKLADLHLWRLGPGHLGAVVSVVTNDVKRDQRFFHKRLRRFRSLSHLTIEVLRTV